MTKGDDGKEIPEYQASHILIRSEPSTETLAELEKKTTEFRNDAEKIGFKEAAGDYGLTVTESKPFSKGNQVPGVGQNQSLNDFAFSAKMGEISDVVSGRTDFIVCQLSRRIPAGYSPFADVKDRLEKQALRDKRVEMAHKHGEELALALSQGKTFEEVAALAGKQIQETDFINRFQFIPKIGSDPDFLGAAFNLSSSNPISRAVESRTGTYLLKYVDHQYPDTSAFTPVSDSLTTKMLQTKQNDIWSKWLNSLKQKAQIEDYRSLYYGS
jgi:parvulin-like peptidyl-prolyl isomerase